MRQQGGRTGFGATVLVPLIFLFLLATPALAADEKPDKNGVAPNTVSLPSGPGSIEGLGEAFQPMLNTGSARYAVKIALPAGTAGHTPDLKLQYESGFGDGPAGIGWVYGPGSISRQIEKGIPRYVDGPNGLDDDYDGAIDEPDELDTFVGPDGEELVPVGGGIYRARIEGGFARFRKVSDAWEVTLKSGTRLDFGKSEGGRVTDATGTKVFRWLLESSTDTNGNVIEYRWATFDGSDGQKYLDEIRYGPGAPPWQAFRFAKLTYADKPDWRADHRSGFLVKTAKRLTGVVIGVQGLAPADAPDCKAGDWNGDGIENDRLVSRYAIAYDPAHPDRSFLSSVTRYGSDGNANNYLPPIRFAYAVADPPASVSADGVTIDSENAPPGLMDSGLAEFVDLNRDGLADILQTDLGGGAHTAWLNLGPAARGGRTVVRWENGRAMASEDGLAPALNLAEQRVHLADMDGDGLSDLVHMTQGGDVAYFPNRGNVSWGEKRRMGAGDTAPSAPFTSKDVTTADLDFDKRMDVVRSSLAGYTLWLNGVEGRYSREIHTPGASYQGRVIQFSDSGVQTADMNGDRVPDVVRVLTNRVVVAYGQGYGRFTPTVEIPIPDVALTDGANGQVARAKLTDVDGDGLADLVVERAEPHRLFCWLNRGTNAFSRRIVIEGMPSVFGAGTVTRWADLNGNGTTDLVYADSSADSRLRAVDIGVLLGGSAHPNLLVRIENGLGVTTAITYRSSTEHAIEAREAEPGRPWTTTVPFPVQLVSEVATTTGMDLDEVPGVDRYLKTYAYRDGYYEDREHAFRGFAEVRVTQPGDETAPTQVSVHGFHTGGPDGADNDGDGDVDEVTWTPRVHREEDALKGLVRYLERRGAGDPGTLYDRDESTWRVRTLLLGTDGTEIRFAYSTRQDKLVYEGTNSPETIRTEYDPPDDFGNPTAERKLGALSIDGDETFSFSEYINDTSRWLLGLPRRQYVTDVAGKRFAETLFYYDGPDYVGLPLGQIEKGRLSRTLGWVKQAEYVNLARTAYDTYGNPIGAIDPNGNRHGVAWDSVFHGYPVREEMEVGGGKPALVTTAEYDLVRGLAISGADFNGHETSFGYDGFGRLTSIVRPGDTEAFPSLAFRYRMVDPAGELTYEYAANGTLSLSAGPASASAVLTFAREVSGQPGTLDSIAYVDGMGRKLAAVGEGESGFIVSGAVRFNALGSVRRAFLPYQNPAAAYTPPDVSPDPARHATEGIYDAVGRAIRQINPPDAQGTPPTETRTVFLPLKTTAIDENLKEKTSLSDGLGRLVEVQEHNVGETYRTRYAYDPLGKLLQVVDAQNNVKTFAYDGLGRNTLLEDPDRGRLEYTYDAAGNLRRRVDNKNQTILYEYDGANRLLAEYPRDGRGPAPSVTYHYDAPSAAFPRAANLLGRLAWVEDESGAEFFSYDAHGQVPWRVKRIKDGGFSQGYRFDYEYDALGRVTRGWFPDGDYADYRYNARSFLESIPGLANAIDYRPSGAIATIAYSNGVTTTYDYDPRERMTRLLTNPPSGTALQDLNYTFDGVGNILAIRDDRPDAPGTPSNATQAFQYDDLYRLIRAEGPGYGAIDYRYDAVGNITFIKSPEAPDPQHIDDALVNLGSMSYGGIGGPADRGWKRPGDPAGPHAVTGTASGLVYDYDDNGNMKYHAGDIYEWDFNDRLVKVTKGGVESSYVYDYTGQRIIKRVNDGATEKLTYYIDETYEIREDKPIKYVFAGTRRVAQIEGRLAPALESGEQIMRLQPGWNLFSLAVEPADSSLAAVLAPIVDKFSGVWAWDAQLQRYFSPTELHAQRGYIIFVTHEAILRVRGARASSNVQLVAGWNLVPNPAERTIPASEAFAPIRTNVLAVWSYDSLDAAWRRWLPAESPGYELPATLAPSGACWVMLDSASVLEPQSRVDASNWLHPDHTGSQALVSSSMGTEVLRAEYYPYGALRNRTPSTVNVYPGYVDKEFDHDARLLYVEARYYEPSMAAFISPDSALGNPSSPQSQNAYSYALRNPLRYVDDDGLAPRLVDYNSGRQGLMDPPRRAGYFRPFYLGNTYQSSEFIIAAIGVAPYGDKLASYMWAGTELNDPDKTVSLQAPLDMTGDADDALGLLEGAFPAIGEGLKNVSGRTALAWAGWAATGVNAFNTVNPHSNAFSHRRIGNIMESLFAEEMASVTEEEFMEKFNYAYRAIASSGFELRLEVRDGEVRRVHYWLGENASEIREGLRAIDAQHQRKRQQEVDARLRKLVEDSDSDGSHPQLRQGP